MPLPSWAIGGQLANIDRNACGIGFQNMLGPNNAAGEAAFGPGIEPGNRRIVAHLLGGDQAEHPNAEVMGFLDHAPRYFPA